MNHTPSEAEGTRRDQSREVYLGLGANVGHRALTLARAVDLLAHAEGVEALDASSVYETAPVGITDQPPFLNMVVRIRSALSPEALLELAQETEQRLGRVRTVRWGPRTLDIDILLIGDLRGETDALTGPHPELQKRQFVLVPLAELAPDLPLPGGRTAGELSAGESDDVHRIGSLAEVSPREAGRQHEPGGGGGCSAPQRPN